MKYLRRYLCHRVNNLIETSNCQPPFLEVGCGTGTALDWLHEKIGAGVGIEVSPEAIAIARQRMEESSSNITLVEESLFDHHGSYKTVLAIDVLEHFPNAVAALQKMHSLLDDDGHLIIFVPAGPYMTDDISFGHSTRYTVPSLAAVLHEAHFKLIRIESFGFPMLTLLRLFKNKFTLEIPPANAEMLIDNSLKSSYTNPFDDTWLSKLYTSFESTKLGRGIVDFFASIELKGRTFSFAAHSIMCVAEKDPDAHV